MIDLGGTPEGRLLRAIKFQEHAVKRATDEQKRAEICLAYQTEVLEHSIGNASIQLILMKDAPNVSERQKLAFASQVLLLQGEVSFDPEAVMTQFDSFTPETPIIFVGERRISPRVITSESRIGVQPNYKKPGVRVSIDCRTRCVNRFKDDDHPEEFVEFNSKIPIPQPQDVVLGLPAFQKYIDAFPSSIPRERKARQAYKKSIAHVFSSIDDMELLGVEGAGELDTQRLAVLRTNVANYEVLHEQKMDSVRRGYGWWPRH